MDKEIKKIEIDLTGCNYYLDFHHRFKRALNFASFYNNNLGSMRNSLRDCEFGYDSFLTIKGVNTMPEWFQEYMTGVIKILDDNKEECLINSKYFDYKIVD